MEAAELIKATRLRHGLSQERLARRVGTRQSAISRLEQGAVSPTIETLQLVLNAMGKRLELTAAPLERRYDPLHRREARGRS